MLMLSERLDRSRARRRRPVRAPRSSPDGGRVSQGLGASRHTARSPLRGGAISFVRLGALAQVVIMTDRYERSASSPDCRSAGFRTFLSLATVAPTRVRSRTTRQSETSAGRAFLLRLLEQGSRLVGASRWLVPTLAALDALGGRKKMRVAEPALDESSPLSRDDRFCKSGNDNRRTAVGRSTSVVAPQASPGSSAVLGLLLGEGVGADVRSSRSRIGGLFRMVRAHRHALLSPPGGLPAPRSPPACRSPPAGSR